MEVSITDHKLTNINNNIVPYGKKYLVKIIVDIILLCM